jgi:PPK2 family polyphosphate:nucleotide phosphotransferase
MVDLSQVSPGEHEMVASKQEARVLLKEYRKRIDSLLRVLAAEAKHSLLVILQGVDASGKDGAVRRVFTGVNPQYCRVVSFKEPDAEELRHDYLWRIYRALPERGELGIFNRSQYEDVLVPYTRGPLTQEDAYVRLRQIADLERIWAENGTAICKMLLHISYEEQADRFRSRLREPAKHWKVKSSDFDDRRVWNKFQSTYQDVLHRTSTSFAPWYIIPADHKWYRDVAIAGVVLSNAQALEPELPMPEIHGEQYELG